MFPFKTPDHHLVRSITALTITALLLSCNTITLFNKSRPISKPQDSPTEQPTVTAQVQAPKPAIPTATQSLPENDNNDQIEVLDFLYTQDFSKPPTDWDLIQYKNENLEVNFSVANGVFSWDIKAVQDSSIMKTADPVIFLPQDSFLLTVAAKIQSQATQASSGIMFRIQDLENFYYAKLSASGEVSAYALENNKWIKLAGPIKSDHFLSGKLNRLTVVDNQGHYELQVNDYPVVNFADDRFKAGSAGLIAELNAGMKETFQFDDFWVMKPGGSAAVLDENPTPQPTTAESGEAYLVYDGEIDGVKYSIEHPANFTFSSASGWDEFCLDVHDSLCVGIRRPMGKWSDPEVMATDLMTGLSKEVSDFNIYHQQHTVTADGFTAYWVGCTYTLNGVKFEGSYTFLVVQNVSFEIAAYGEPEMMKTYQPIIKKIMESFLLGYN
jgi:hypothetical protein